MNDSLIKKFKLECESMGLKVVEKARMSPSGQVSPPALRMITPFIYKGKEIKWIDAAFMIGDLNTHPLVKKRLDDLIKCYGSGLFIFWLGYSKKDFNDYSEHVVIRANFSIDASEIKVLDAIEFPYNPNPEVVADTACDPPIKATDKKAADADDDDQPCCSSHASQRQPTSSNISGEDSALARGLDAIRIADFFYKAAKPKQKVSKAYKQRLLRRRR